MGRLIFDCRDKDGNLVHVETAEANFQDLLARYGECVRILEEHGFTLVKARGGRPPKEKVKFDGKHCPVCGAAVYDNRPRKESGEWKQNAPDFSCSNRECTGGKGKDGQPRPWAAWPGQYEIVGSA